MANRNLANNTAVKEEVLSNDLDEVSALNQSSYVVKTGEMNVSVFSTTVAVNRGLSNQMNECVKSKINRNAEKCSIQKGVVSVKKKFIEKEKEGKRPYLGLKGFLMMILGFLVFAIGAGAWSYVLMGLGLLIFGIGGLVILYSIIRPRK
jgi:hypothetical protein